MESISQMAEKCQKCPDRDKYDHKRMEACAYIDLPKSCVSGIPEIEPLISINVGNGISKSTESILKEIEKTISRISKKNCAW